MINDGTEFKTVDKNFRPEDHMIELADGTKESWMAKMRGDARIYLLDSKGRRVRTRLKQALYIPSFPQNSFSVKAATANGAEVRFKDVRVRALPNIPPYSLWARHRHDFSTTPMDFITKSHFWFLAL